MSNSTELPEAAEAAPDAALGTGAQLRVAREKLGLSQADVAARTRISARHIADLETGNYAAFTSRTYAIGFARTVAKAVGLDGDAVAGQVRAELNALQPAARSTDSYETSDPARVPSRPLVWLSLVAVGLLLAGLFVAWRTMFSPAAELPSLVPPEPAVEQPVASGSAAPATAAPAPTGPVTFTAAENGIWVRFYDAGGIRLLEKEMALGESFTVPATANGPMIRTARPEALRITIGGRPVAPLATEMMTLRDVKVDAASLLARPAAPAAAPSAAPSASASAAPVVATAPLRQVPLSVALRGAARVQPTVRATRSAAPALATPLQDTAEANAASAAAAATEAATAPPPVAAPAGEAEPAGE